MSELNLKSGFPPKTQEDWRALVEAGLRGAAFETLNRQTEDGLFRVKERAAEEAVFCLAI